MELPKDEEWPYEHDVQRHMMDEQDPMRGVVVMPVKHDAAVLGQPRAARHSQRHLAEAAEARPVWVALAHQRPHAEQTSHEEQWPHGSARRRARVTEPS